MDPQPPLDERAAEIAHIAVRLLKGYDWPNEEMRERAVAEAALILNTAERHMMKVREVGGFHA